MNRLLRIAPLVLMTLLHGSGLRAAGIAEQSERLFNTMTNATAPSAHLGQRRGVFDGGSLQARSRIAAESLWHIVPPSFEAGCGGIDLYAGSFSFINAEQFQALLRAIAANAAGYAFQLAVNAMSREAGELMSKLQDTLQKLNQGFADSCQLAQGLVNDTVSAFQGTLTAKTSQTLATTGIGDIFETWTTSTGQGPATQAKTNLTDEQRSQADLQGNIVWQALKRSNVAARFVGGDDRLLEAIMSVTGSIIVGPAETAPDGAGESARITPLRGNVLSVRDLLWGPRVHERDPNRRTTQVVQRYDCVDRNVNACLDPQIVGEDALVGLVQYTSRMLLGDPRNAANVGLVEKFRWGNLAFTDAEKAFMELAPHGVGAMLRNLGQHDSGTARAFAEQASPIIALEMTKLLIDDLIRQVEGVVAIHDSPYAKQAIEQIRAAKEDVAQEYTELAQRHGNLPSLMQYYGNLALLLKGRSLLSGVLDAGSESAN
ncbi:MAG TPA: conjugal transfer protein TraH [Lamprocystis sp. (in: g-proteobacteria)]|nr:conjugal transfer protein TraH [Lamprocystis sp. (in: g-proteobacteria)]